MARKKAKHQTQTRNKSRVHSAERYTQLELLVKAGVERFILKDATIADFLKTIRSAGEREEISPHPLTRSVFSKIVKEAIKKRSSQKMHK